MVKHTQTIRREFADELFKCVWPFCDYLVVTAHYLVVTGGYSSLLVVPTFSMNG